MPRRTIGIPGVIRGTPTNRLAMPTGRVPGSLVFTVKPRVKRAPRTDVYVCDGCNRTVPRLTHDEHRCGHARGLDGNDLYMRGQRRLREAGDDDT